jgi:hypothetical protein
MIEYAKSTSAVDKERVVFKIAMSKQFITKVSAPKNNLRGFPHVFCNP